MGGRLKAGELSIKHKIIIGKGYGYNIINIITLI
jgi:hypothetical protein